MGVRSRITWHGDAVIATIDAAAVVGLTHGAEHLLAEAVKEVPLEEGTLQRSGVASVDEAALRAAVSFDTVYAVRQHEELTWQHDAGRKAKYLEDPLNREAAVIDDLPISPELVLVSPPELAGRARAALPDPPPPTWSRTGNGGDIEGKPFADVIHGDSPKVRRA